jgi:hypothetical protein
VCVRHIYVPIHSHLNLKVKKYSQGFRFLWTRSRKGLTARETKDIRKDHLQTQPRPHGPRMDIEHPRDVDPSITGQPHQVNGQRIPA